MPDSSNYHGMSATARTSLGGTVAKAQTSVGTTQATALKIGSDHTQFTTVAASSGAVLPAPNAGEWRSVFNGGANALTVYPNVGGTINGGSVNAGVSVAAGKGALFIPLDGLTWFAIISS